MLQHCSWWICQSCNELTPVERPYIAAMTEEVMKYPFMVWDRGRREDSSGHICDRRLELGQPAKLRNWLLIGDLADAADVGAGKLKHLRITAVLNLCPQFQSTEERQTLEQNLRNQGVQDYLELFAEDRRDYEIIQNDLAASLEFTRRVRDSGGAVLVHCYGGVNRSGAIVVALLMLLERSTLLAATAETVAKRGYVLSNESFRRQLVLLASHEQLLEGQRSQSSGD